jgi:branched-chain amino acid transport system substrate-binding protein
VHDKGQGTGPKDEVGQVLYMRGVMSAMLGVEGRPRARKSVWQGQGHDRRAGALGLRKPEPDQAKLDALGFKGVMRPISTSCADHMGSTWARMHTWDGAKWELGPTGAGRRADHQAHGQGAADKYAAEKKLTRRTPADCQS